AEKEFLAERRRGRDDQNRPELLAGSLRNQQVNQLGFSRQPSALFAPDDQAQPQKRGSGGAGAPYEHTAQRRGDSARQQNRGRANQKRSPSRNRQEPWRRHGGKG